MPITVAPILISDPHSALPGSRLYTFLNEFNFVLPDSFIITKFKLFYSAI
jgi:rRNA maturation protein Rpf1